MKPSLQKMLAATITAVFLSLGGPADARAQATFLPAGVLIQDNSFLLEEAYNQEAGVVQHISSFTRFWDSKSWAYTFTQEWPIPSLPRHQLSFTATVVRAGSLADSAGFGDTAINYRYQLLGSSTTRFAFSPRLSVLLPSGKPQYGRGFGGTSVQGGLPFSIVLHPRLTTHVNLGITHTPHARNEFGESASTTAYTTGQSFVFTVRPRINLMLETLWVNFAEIAGPGVTHRSNEVLVSPGVRWSHNFSDGLQIVPGVAVPIGVGPSAGERGFILYLSFEYNMWNER